MVSKQSQEGFKEESINEKVSKEGLEKEEVENMEQQQESFKCPEGILHNDCELVSLLFSSFYLFNLIYLCKFRNIQQISTNYARFVGAIKKGGFSISPIRA